MPSESLPQYIQRQSLEQEKSPADGICFNLYYRRSYPIEVEEARQTAGHLQCAPAVPQGRQGSQWELTTVSLNSIPRVSILKIAPARSVEGCGNTRLQKG